MWRSAERDLLLIDLALPRDIDAAVSALPHVELWTLDDLQARVEANLAQRSAAIAPVEAIVEQETALFLDWLRSREVAPVITDLQRWARGVAETRNHAGAQPTRRAGRAYRAGNRADGAPAGGQAAARADRSPQAARRRR